MCQAAVGAILGLWRLGVCPGETDHLAGLKLKRPCLPVCTCVCACVCVWEDQGMRIWILFSICLGPVCGLGAHWEGCIPGSWQARGAARCCRGDSCQQRGVLSVCSGGVARGALCWHLCPLCPATSVNPMIFSFPAVVPARLQAGRGRLLRFMTLH